MDEEEVDDEVTELDFSLNYPTRDHHYSLKHFYKCPLCRALMPQKTKYSYCFECNWDSLTDPCLESKKYAA